MADDTLPSIDQIVIRDRIRPGDWGAIISLHGSIYCTEYGFAPAFEAFVAKTVAEFVLEAAGDGKVWVAEAAGRLVGCTAVVCRRDEGGDWGQIRWVLLHPSVRGLGLGSELLARAIAYCRSCGFQYVRLETTDGLDASLRMYLKTGFKIVDDAPADLWGERRRLITMELDLAPGGDGAASA